MATTQQKAAIRLRNRKRAGFAAAALAMVSFGATYAERTLQTNVASQHLATPDKTSLTSAHNAGSVAGAQTDAPPVIAPIGSVRAPLTAGNPEESIMVSANTNRAPTLTYGASAKTLTIDDAAVIALLANQRDSICMTPECGRADVDRLEKDVTNGKIAEDEKEIAENNVTAGIVLALMRTQIVRASDGRPAPDSEIREDLAKQPPVESIIILARQKARHLIATYAPDAHVLRGEQALQDEEKTTRAGADLPAAVSDPDEGSGDDSKLASIFMRLHPQPYEGMSGAVVADVIEYCRRNGGVLPNADRQWATQTIASDTLIIQSQIKWAKQGNPMTYAQAVRYLAIHGVNYPTKLRYYHTAADWFNKIGLARFCRAP